MTDPLEITRNPGNDFRCSAHESMLEMTMDLKGDVKEMRAVVKGLDEKVDILSSTMRTGFVEVNEQLRTMSHDRTSDIKNLGGRLDSQDRKLSSLSSVSSTRAGGIETLKTLIPWILTLISVATIIAIAVFK